MLFKSTFALAFVALANIASATVTPACVLSVVGDTNNPDNVPAICASDSLQSAIEKKCDNVQSSLKFVSNICKSYGYDFDYSSSSSNTTSSATSTGTGFVTATATGGSKATGTSGATTGTSTGSTSGSGASGSASASPTPSTAGAITGHQLSGTTFVAALFFGAAALL
ncbi:hypothetical protein N7478_006840 [Penicillium angulare]|uniref:uncharacterized protein n=1 Tax=Penicillium angulare TaxID=116970 RepID=UPI0025408AA2|nr:uncharacterized protein N7478_006840 [Penicillium angulare]KAJ5281468.1 hypothetical protein N7478_006840 [Penicillium angulare]